MDADQELFEAARAAFAHAHAPLSGYHVGAALRTPLGRIVSGCNVEDLILSNSTCAERVAIFKGVSEGERAFEAVAVYTLSEPPAAPCGCCRQALHSWGVKRVILGNEQGIGVVVDLAELLPRAFGPRDVDAKPRS